MVPVFVLFALGLESLGRERGIYLDTLVWDLILDLVYPGSGIRFSDPSFGLLLLVVGFSVLHKRFEYRRGADSVGT